MKEAEEGGSSYLFHNCHGEPYRSCRTAFEYAVKQARIKGFRFHDLTYARLSFGHGWCGYSDGARIDGTQNHRYDLALL